MKTHPIRFACALLLTSILPAPATVLYVDVNSTNPVAPYTSWSTAAAVIQDAIDAAAPGDQILVTDGVYQTGGRTVYGALTNRVVLDKAVAVQSVNGPAVTIIAGNPFIGETAVRCAYLTNGASLTGFTLTQGATRGVNQGDLRQEQSGGGAWCESDSAMLTNCVFAANQANFDGGGVIRGTLEGCLLYSNATSDLDVNAIGGGGAANSVLNHCTLRGNSASDTGGGASESVLNDCVVAGNSAGQYGGGVSGSTLVNCLLTHNVAGTGAGGANQGTLYNCTLVGNSATTAGGAYQGTLYNCIVYYNTCASLYASSNYIGTLVRCCTAPAAGSGNFTNAPGFVDLANGDLHLQPGSFCINAGDNASASSTLDLEGNPRVVGPYVDVGAYEYQASAPVPLSVSCRAGYTNVATGYAVTCIGDIAGHETASFWDFGDGARVTNQLSLSHAWTNPGSYTVTFTAWNDDQPAGVSATTTVLVLDNPTYYVALGNPNAAAPYSSWASAAANIQDAVDLAYVAGTVWVSNGVYETGGQWIGADPNTNRVMVTKPLLVQSVHGPAVTIIKGYRGPATTNDSSSIRCAWLSSGATLSGFTLSNGCCLSTGGGVRAAGAVVTNCMLVGNASRFSGGGGASGNYYSCLLAGNSAGTVGGGVYGGALNNCVVVSNSAAGLGGGAYGGFLTNCTLVGNYSAGAGGGACQASLRNCIVYYNNIGSVVAGGTNTSSATLNYCCTTPLIANTGNFTNAPAFVNMTGGDFHLLASSPCINAGDNNSVAGSADMDGNPRIRLGKVDLGPYEFQKTIHYVGPHYTAGPIWPYTSWATAAFNIQDAVDAAAPGEFVVVTNGTYSAGGRAVYGSATNVVALTNGVTLLSVNGAPATIITGGPQTRCAYVGSNSVLSGFTLSGGQTPYGGEQVRELSGAGAWCESGGVVRDCFITGNRTLSAGSLGGGVYGGTVYNCTLSNNIAGSGGAAVAAALQNCLLVSNSAPYSSPYGLGGALYKAAATNCTLAGNGSVNNSWYGTSGGGACQSTLVNCLLVTNASTYGGGGAQDSLLVNCTLSQNQGMCGGAYQCTNYNCILSRNVGSGGGIRGGVAYNCLVVSNTASFGGGAYMASPISCTLYNCTVIGNTGTNGGGGLIGATAYNSIVYYNTASSGANWAAGALVTCCTYPPLGGLTSEPSFVDLAGGNFRLQTNSSCINSGNNTYLTNSTDLDGNPRLVAGTVDIGAYEFQNPVSAISYAWLQQYGLPINASTDTADPDGDGLNNWQEWQAGTMPNNSSSVLKVLAPTNSASGITVCWQSAWGKTYFVQRSTTLAAPLAFVTFTNNVASQGSTTSCLDPTATNAGPYFYRVGVQQP